VTLDDEGKKELPCGVLPGEEIDEAFAESFATSGPQRTLGIENYSSARKNPIRPHGAMKESTLEGNTK
jgi:hypothetical protein